MKTIAEAPLVEQHQANDLEQADSEALYRLGLLSQQNGQLQEAEKYLTAAIQAQPDMVKAWFSLGNLRFSIGQFKTAEVAYRQALALQPHLVTIHNNLGYTLEKQGLVNEAIACYQTALEIQPKCIEASINLGNALHAQAKLSPEQQAYYSDLNEQLGTARLEAGDVKTAIAYFRQAIVLQPNSVRATYNLGVALSKQDDLEQAITCFEKVIELNPSYGEAYLKLGQIYYIQKQLQKAVAAYRQGLSTINPCYAKAVEADFEADIAEEAPVTPPITKGEVIVGQSSFPAIPTLPNTGKRPFWTVILPVYQRTEYILDCLAGVLAQWPGEDEMEILVLDNASTHPLFDLVNSIGKGIIKYYRHPENLGVVGNVNIGLALSRGEWVHILHDDDCVYPGFYSQLKQSLLNCPPSVGAAFTGFNYIDEKGEKVSNGDIVSVYGDNKGILQDWLQEIGVCGLIAVPAVVVKRTTHEYLGGYCPEIQGIDEWEMYKRIAVFYDCWYEPEILAGFRVHPHRETSNNWLSGSLPKAIRRAIEITETYLPSKWNAEITAKSRRHNFNYCMQHAIIPLKAGNLAATFRILQEALKIDHSSEAVVKLFEWLNQNEAVHLREQIISKLILSCFLY
ncbi:MAG: tetratricopeptide repeat protein [Calothrix sp. C42_A2020_038]|nr:tetratricopeptide repeat protein [Calothrix sp. C42_A2020_038]